MTMMSEDEEKTVVYALFQDDKLPFAYDIRDNITNPSKFPNPRYDINVFKPDIKVAVEIQVHIRNFKRKENKASSFGYLFWHDRIYKLEDVKIPLVSMLEKRQRRKDK